MGPGSAASAIREGGADRTMRAFRAEQARARWAPLLDSKALHTAQGQLRELWVAEALKRAKSGYATRWIVATAFWCFAAVGIGL